MSKKRMWWRYQKCAVTCSVRRHCCNISGQSRSSQPEFSRQWTGRNRNMHSIRADIRHALWLQTVSAPGVAACWRTPKCVKVTEYISTLQPRGDLIFSFISDRALADNDVSDVLSETALADSWSDTLPVICSIFDHCSTTAVFLVAFSCFDIWTQNEDLASILPSSAQVGDFYVTCRRNRDY